MQDSIIAWCDVTWNPTFGCSKVSEGCRHCYAETIALRFKHSKKPWTTPNAGENVQLKEHKLREPYKLKEPMRVFVNSMSDLFHEQVPDEYIAKVFAVMNDLPQHTFQVLTKRPERAATWPGPWTDNIWMGTSVEDYRVAHRIAELRECDAKVRFLSCEPLIGPLEESLDFVDFSGIHWIIVGGESGAHMKSPDNPRWMRQEWARHIRDLCEIHDTAYFYKQDAGIRTEMRPWLVEEDGSHTHIRQYPDEAFATLAAQTQDLSLGNAEERQPSLLG